MALFGHHKNKKKKENKIIPGHSLSTQFDNLSVYNSNSKVGPPLPVNKWIDKPLLMCINPSCDKYLSTNYNKQIAIPINTVFEFESRIFKGKGICRAVDLPNTDKSYFKGRSRKMDFTFQGEFKRRICFDRLYTGQVFDKPFTKIPGQYLVSAAIKLVKSLAPALISDINCSAPHMISPLASAAQVFQICKPGDEIPIPLEPKEDLTLLAKKFKNMSWTDRKKYFHNLDHLKEHYFEPGYNYTISCYSHMISPSSYAVHMLGMKWGIHQYIPSPMQIATVILPPNDSGSINEADDASSTATSSTTSNDDETIETSPKSSPKPSILSVPDEPLETMLSEELACESKEDDISFDDSGQNLNRCEFLYEFQIWHTKLVDELYPKQTKKGGNGFKMFGGH
eukprot:88647_1